MILKTRRYMEFTIGRLERELKQMADKLAVVYAKLTVKSALT